MTFLGYKTEDWAHYLLDDNIKFLGRLDHLVKLRSFRLDQSEIDVIATQQPAIQQVVMAREDVTCYKGLVGYSPTNK